jgi:hypothetical protein
MCEPVSITLGILSAGLGIAQSVAGYQQAQENVAIANAQAEQSFRFQQMQASSARAFEQLKSQQQAAIMDQNRYLADQAYENDIGQLNLRLVQEQEAAAERARQAALAGQQGRGEVRATGRLGMTVDNLIADYYRQQAVFDYVTERNLAFAQTQTQMEKTGAAARRGSRIASQQPYLEQPILDPLEPIYQAAPSATPYILSGIGAGIGGVQTGMSAYGQISKIKAGQPPKVPKAPAGASLAPNAGVRAPDYSSYFRSR